MKNILNSVGTAKLPMLLIPLHGRNILFQTMSLKKKLLEKVSENIVEKEENADKQRFLLFPQCFGTF